MRAIKSFMSDPPPLPNPRTSLRKSVVGEPRDTVTPRSAGTLQASPSPRVCTEGPESNSRNASWKPHFGGRGEFQDLSMEPLPGTTGTTEMGLLSQYPPSDPGTRRFPSNDGRHAQVPISNAPHTELHASLRELRRQLRLKDDEILALKSEVNSERIRLLEQEERGERYEKQIRELTQREQQTTTQLKQLKGRCEEAESKLEARRSQLRALREELGIANAFIRTGDQFSVADVTRLVEELNVEIYNAAMNLSDIVYLERGGLDDGKQPADSPTVRRVVAGCYGEELLSKLDADLAASNPDSTLFECLIQNVFVTRSIYLIQTIYPGNASFSKLLKSAWDKMSDTYEPAIAKNWLAMTSSHLKMGVESTTTNEILSCLLAVGGRRLGSSSEHKLHLMAAEKLSEIQQKALKVREMAMEGILSANVEPIHAPRKAAYDSSYMEDAYISQGQAHNDFVVCQTGVGLRFSRTSRPSNPTVTQREGVILLKAKVLLSSGLTSPV